MKKSIIFFSLMWSLLAANIVFATKQRPTDFAWFKVQAEFDTTDLPRGVSIIKKDNEPSLYQNGKWFISNQGTTPLYLVKKKIDRHDNTVKINVFPELKIPSDLVPIYKLISNEVYYPRKSWNDQYRGLEHDLEGKHYELDKLAETCSFTKGYCRICANESCSMVSLDSLDHGSVLHGLGIIPTKNIHLESRPDNPVIPEPESFKLLVYYGNHPIEFKGKFVYSLNNNYGKK